MKITEIIKKKNKKLDLSVSIFLIIGIVIIVNIFSYQIFYRWDLTQNRIYSISKSSKNTVTNLDDIVNVKAYFSQNLPSQILTLRQEVEDMLDEYQNYSNGKFRVEFIDPGDNEDLQRELYLLGIPQLQFNVQEKDKAEIVKGYIGMAISFGDKTEVIPAVVNTQDLEYKITAAIKKASTDDIATIGLVTSHNTASMNGNAESVREKLEELYDVENVNLANDSVVSENIDTLIIIGAEEEFNEDQLKSLNAFLVRGGDLIVLADSVLVDNSLVVNQNITNLDEFLREYGVLLNKDLVGDMQNSKIYLSQGNFPIPIPFDYPFWPRISGTGFNDSNGAVAGLENVILPWASSVGIDENIISKDNVVFLANSTINAWTEKENYNINPNGLTVPSEKSQYNFALLISGGLKDVYAVGEEPVISNGRLVVVGDSDFIKDGNMQFLANTGQYNDNLTFFQNLVDLLSFDEDLINIRSKNVTSRPIKEDLTDAERIFHKYFNVFGITALVIVFGMTRYFLRKKSKFVDEI